MGFIMRDSSDKSILHQNEMSANDFNRDQLESSEWVNLSLPFGDMKMRQWVFDGIRLAYTDWELKKPHTFEWEGNMDVVTMYYSLKGGVSIGSDSSNSFELGNNQQNMFYGSKASGFMKVDELRMKSFMVQFNKDAFLRIAEGGTDSLKYFADCVAGKKDASFSKNGLPLHFDVQNVISSILKCNYNDSLKQVFFHSKAMELLVLQADAQIQSLKKKDSYVKTDYDRDRIVFAREYMLQHIELPPTIAELAKVSGINEFKLKKGYKEIFGTTIFGHLAETRLQLAKELLLDNKKSVSEIAFELGYSSVQHFTLAFKNKFGITPGKVG